MLHTIKKRLYFVVAAYFAFWASFVLRRWRPKVIVVTGSSGKTTLLHLIEAQLGDRAIYSHHANSAIGLPLHILGMEPNVPSRLAWFRFVLQAPLHAWRKVPTTPWYIAEADCDRPKEGRFIARFLKPEMTLWVSVYRTHSMNFDPLVKAKVFKTHEAAIAHEFGYYIAAATAAVAVNSDQPNITAQLSRVAKNVKVIEASQTAVSQYRLTASDTVYTIGKQQIHVPGLHPQELGIGLQLINALLEYLEVPLDPTYQRFQMPPGRSNELAGQNNCVLIDSTYNTGLDATRAVLALFSQYPHGHKWLVLGDILEQGSLEKEEHERLASAIATVPAECVVLVGPRTRSYTMPLLQQLQPQLQAVAFENPAEALGYLQQHLQGGEALLFKGGRYLEGIIEQLLANPADADLLVRRGPQWIKRRQQWGLPQ